MKHIVNRAVSCKRRGKLKYYPVGLNLSGKKVVFAGGGQVASRKIGNLIHFDCNILVVAPRISKEIKVLLNEGEIKYIKTRYQTRHIDGAFMVFAATNKSSVNKKIADDCKERGILCNRADSSDSAFITMAGIYKKEFVAAVHTNGAQPKKSAELIRQIKRALCETQ